MRVWRLSVAYIGHKSRTERHRKTKIGTEVAHVTRDLDTTSKVKGQLAGGVAYCGGLAHSLFVSKYRVLRYFTLILSAPNFDISSPIHGIRQKRTWRQCLGLILIGPRKKSWLVLFFSYDRNRILLFLVGHYTDIIYYVHARIMKYYSMPVSLVIIVLLLWRLYRLLC